MAVSRRLEKRCSFNAQRLNKLMSQKVYSLYVSSLLWADWVRVPLLHFQAADPYEKGVVLITSMFGAGKQARNRGNLVAWRWPCVGGSWWKKIQVQDFERVGHWSSRLKIKDHYNRQALSAARNVWHALLAFSLPRAVDDIGIARLFEVVMSRQVPLRRGCARAQQVHLPCGVLEPTSSHSWGPKMAPSWPWVGLLEIMGFVHLNNKYWIWPLVGGAKRGLVGGNEFEIPRSQESSTHELNGASWRCHVDMFHDLAVGSWCH